MAAGQEHLSKARPVLAAMLCLLVSTACDARSAPYDAAPWLADYAALKKGLERSYANLAWFASPEGGIDLAALDRKTVTALAEARSDKEAKAALTAFLKAIPDAHLQLVDPHTAAELAAQDGPDHGLIRDLMAGPCRAYNLDDGLKTDFSLPFDKAGARRITRGKNPFASGLYDTPQGLRLGIVRIPSFEMRQYPDLCRGAAEQLRRTGETDTVDFEDFVQTGFLQFLAQTLQDLQRRGAQAVVVDLGGNPGGGDSGQLATGLFAAAPLKSNPIWMVAGPPAVHLFDHQLAVLRAAQAHAGDDAKARRDLGAAISAVAAQEGAIPARACDMAWVWREQRPWGPRGCSNLVEAGYMAGPAQTADWRAYADPASSVVLYAPADLGKLQGTWRGPVYVVVDETTASAAELFGAILQDNHAARLVGRRTIGAGCGNQGPYRFLPLKQMDASVRLSDCVLIRADGSDEVAGVEPDIAIDGRDPVQRAHETLARIAEDLQKPPPAITPPQDTARAPR